MIKEIEIDEAFLTLEALVEECKKKAAPATTVDVYDTDNNKKCSMVISRDGDSITLFCMSTNTPFYIIVNGEKTPDWEEIKQRNVKFKITYGKGSASGNGIVHGIRGGNN